MRLTIVAIACVALSIALLASGWAVWSPVRSGSAPGPVVEPATGTRSATDPSANAKDAPSGVRPRFRDATESAGIHFSYFRGESGRWWTMEPAGGGVAFFDGDSDGWLDLFWVSGCQLPDSGEDRDHPHRFFRNNRDGTFAEVTDAAGLTVGGYGMGIQAGDYDNDGFSDLYLTRYGPNDLYRNNGDGTFTRVTEAAGVECPPVWSSSSMFADLDRDGDQDLYVCHYVNFDPETHQPCRHGGKPDGDPEYCGPHQYEGIPDRLFRNEGDGTFVDISEPAGVQLSDSKGLGVVAADFNNDGWPDVFVANDLVPNFLFINRRDLKFENVAQLVGVAWNAGGRVEASMGIACGDIDNNGYLDVAVTHFYQEHTTLYQNLGVTKHGMLSFVDNTGIAGLARTTRTTMGWGTDFIDYDRDGLLDLFQTNGHLNGDPEGPAYAMRGQLFHNIGSGRFKEVTSEAGPYFQSLWVGRGSAAGDYDNDGHTDLAVLHHFKPSVLLHNDTKTPNHVIGLMLVGRESNRDAINARVNVYLRSNDGTEQRMLREVFGGGSYQSAVDRRLLIGLGEHTRVQRVEVVWPSGQVDRWQDLDGDRQWLLIEGRVPTVLREFQQP